MMSALPARQLALNLPHAENFRREDFLPDASNEAAIALIDAWPRWPSRVMALAGPEGAGKSHIASIWSERSGARIVEAGSLDASGVPGALATGALVLEHVHPARADEHALFHLLNLASQEEADILFTARARTDLEGFRLPDLASRLRAVPVVTLQAPGDALIAAVLVKLFADRQMAVEQDVVAYLVPRIERSLAAVRKIVAQLDLAALSRGRRMTRALAAEVLRERRAAGGAP